MFLDLLMMIATPRAKPFTRIATAAAISLALTSFNASAETVASATATPAATTTNAVLNANAKVGATRTATVTGKPAVRARQTPRMAATPEQCSVFWCGRRQVSWLVLGVGF